MDPATAALAALGLVAVLLAEQAASHYAVWSATRAGADRELAARDQRDAEVALRHDAERALEARLRVEQAGRIVALQGEAEQLRREIAALAAGGREDLAALRLVDAGEPGDAGGVLSAFPPGPAAGRDPVPAPGAAAAPGRALVAPDA